MSNLDSTPPGRHKAIWPEAVITLGVSLTVAWAILIGYGLIRLIEHAI
jgi:hypothetical protein